jgi:fluoride ion exporter CrcB/FEX
MNELLLVVIGGFVGGCVRGIVGVLKAWRNGRKIRKKYLTATLVASALIGMIAGLFAESDIKFSILAGYVGTDFIENLYKVRYREKYRPSNRKVKIP